MQILIVSRLMASAKGVNKNRQQSRPVRRGGGGGGGCDGCVRTNQITDAEINR